MVVWGKGSLVLLYDEHNRTLISNVLPAEWQNSEQVARYNLVVIGAGTDGSLDQGYVTATQILFSTKFWEYSNNTKLIHLDTSSYTDRIKAVSVNNEFQQTRSLHHNIDLCMKRPPISSFFKCK